MKPITTSFQFDQYMKAVETTSCESYTKWSLVWAKNVRSFGDSQEKYGARFRALTIDAQQRYEDQLRGVMHYRSHQQEF